MNRNDDRLIIAALLLKAGGKVTLTVHDIERARRAEITEWRLPEGRSIEFSAVVPIEIDGEVIEVVPKLIRAGR